MFLERSFAEEVDEVPIVQGAQETHFGTLAERFGIGQSFRLVEEEIELGDVISQADIYPFGTLAGRVPRKSGELRDVHIVLPYPDALVGREFVAIEYGTVEARFAFVLPVEVRRASQAFLSGQS